MRLILNRDDLVNLLQEDEEIRDLIRKLALGQSEEAARPEEPVFLEASKEEIFSSKKQELRQKLEEVRRDRDRWQQEAQLAVAEKDKVAGERNRTLVERDDMADQLKQVVREKEQAFRAMEESNHKVEEARRIVSKLQAEITFLQERLDEAKGSISTLTADLDRTREEREDLKEDLQQAEQELSQRFAQGWQLYEAYQEVDDYYRGLLSDVMARPGFEAFIVGLSQDRSLQKIWDVTREAVMKGHDDDTAKTLWRLFQYSMDLVNQGRSQDLYAVEDVKVGDFYDIDLHALTVDSRNQGCLTEVYLPGYRNVSTGKIVHKSQVKI